MVTRTLRSVREMDPKLSFLPPLPPNCGSAFVVLTLSLRVEILLRALSETRRELTAGRCQNEGARRGRRVSR
jgi:hypothetical protein